MRSKTSKELMWIATGYLIAKMDLVPSGVISDFMKVVAVEYELKLKKYTDKHDQKRKSMS